MLIEKFKHTKIILASTSPRRQELFKQLHIPFSVQVKPVNEIYPPNLKASEITTYLANLKAAAFENEIAQNKLIITSDTIVWFNNKALEKPKNSLEAINMLKTLSGNSHQVITSVCIKTFNIQHVF